MKNININHFVSIIIELDNIKDGLFLHIAKNDKVVNVSFDESSEFKNYHLAEFEDDLWTAVDVKDEKKINYFNSLIEQANKLVEDDSTKYLNILVDYYEKLILDLKDKEQKEVARWYRNMLIEKRDEKKETRKTIVNVNFI